MLQLSKSLRMRTLASLEDSYELCRQITAEYSKTFYMGTQLMPEAKRRAIWAIYVWCRRTDELVDGPMASSTTAETLDHWEKHLESLFAGHPIDDEDVALVDTLSQYPLDIQPFRDMIAGQRMDLYRSRYETFEELKLYCYRVAGTVGLMSMAVMGVAQPDYQAPWDHELGFDIPTEEAIALGIANQLTNILRDVGEDARRGRIYLPLEELALFNYTQEDLLKGVVDDRWRELMRFQIQRARKFYTLAERGIRALSPDIRWPVWSALLLYSKILDEIERNRYDVFTRRAYVPTQRKMFCLPVALLRSIVL
ncbi:phytoene synthase [Limnoraphis robusta Tam1]|uniref:Phytoene synthase n=1 Tax=Limnoraphis robusta CCNP1315 TaxID=3110306 RepID=A0ABU5TYF1_9CYAN|nr:phytoene synthase [Limnoraphis robusta]MEA5499128.1 phytoene synthase [Limnoraphis robusta BA-68 BA1]MEA5519820.1 phytoene synthase [Limnoraphis robusta CCNP1315]MEA5537607.1 phytoene synthase [Limnoraphis robusta Tam1]MEA5547855.1 phytoene synthase [Limnoraphis robusta CCNP1324]